MQTSRLQAYRWRPNHLQTRQVLQPTYGQAQLQAGCLHAKYSLLLHRRPAAVSLWPTPRPRARCQAASNDAESTVPTGSGSPEGGVLAAVQKELQGMKEEAKVLAIVVRQAFNAWLEKPESKPLEMHYINLEERLKATRERLKAKEEHLDNMRLESMRLEKMRQELQAQLTGADGGGRQLLADEATWLWWRVLPQAEVKTVVLKVLPEEEEGRKGTSHIGAHPDPTEEEGDVAIMPAAEQTGGKHDVVKVPAAVLHEVMREVAEVTAAAQTGEEGDQVEGCCSVKAELLQLAHGTTFPGTIGPGGKPLSRLLLRKCYHSMVDQCFKLAEKGTRNVMVMGSTGAGMSFGVHELLRRLRLAGKTVVWQRVRVPHVLLLCPDGTAWRGTLTDFYHELGSRDTWYICDGVEPFSFNATTVFITSPPMASINNFIKRCHEQLWVGRWTWTELLAARQYIWHTVTVATLKDRVDIVGKLPRYALEQADCPHTLEAVQSAIWVFDVGPIVQAVSDITTAPLACHKLVHVVASDDCRFLTFDWASPSVENEVTAGLVIRDLDGVEAFVRDRRRTKGVDRLRGALFQRLGGALIAAGGELSSRSLDDQTEKPLCLPRQTLLDVRELPDKLEPEHYYRLARAIEPGVDAISALSREEEGAPMEVILWQFTLRDTHPVDPVALRKTLLQLDKVQPEVVIRGMYYAVHADVYNQWESRQDEKKDNTTSEAARLVTIQQAQEQKPSGESRASKQSQEEPVLRDAGAAVGRIKQFAVRIPGSGVSKRLEAA